MCVVGLFFFFVSLVFFFFFFRGGGCCLFVFWGGRRLGGGRGIFLYNFEPISLSCGMDSSMSSHYWFEHILFMKKTIWRGIERNKSTRLEVISLFPLPSGESSKLVVDFWKLMIPIHTKNT